MNAMNDQSMVKGRGLQMGIDTSMKDSQGAVLEAAYCIQVASNPFLTNRQFSVLGSLNLSVAFDAADYLFHKTLSL